jgi:hypothetical protein
MKTLAVLAIVTAFSATAANAQITSTFGPPQPPLSPFGVDPIMRVSSVFRVAVTSEPTAPFTDPKAQEAARRTLYGMAEGECAILSEVFKAECRLGSVSIILGPIGPNAPMNLMSATVAFELRPKAR